MIDTVIVGCLFIISFFHLMRLNHFIPSSFKGEYQLMVQKAIDKNLEALRLENTKEDTVYENKWALDYDDDDLATMPFIPETSFWDSCFSVVDISVQVYVLSQYAMTVLAQEGYIGAVETELPRLSLIALFILAHINQSKYIGISQVDSF